MRRRITFQLVPRESQTLAPAGTLETMPYAATQADREPPEGAAATPSSSCLVCDWTAPETIQRTCYQHQLQCDRCGLFFGWPVYSRESLLAYAEATFRGEGLPETAVFFERRRTGRTDSPLHRQYRSGLQQIERVVPSGRLLDVGCGEPVFLDLARSEGYEVEGLDTVAEAAAIAREEFGLDVHTAPFDRCELPDGSFDVITMWDFLEHVPEPIETLARAHRLLSKGGVLFVSSPNYRSVLHGVARRVSKLPFAPIRDALDKLYHFSHVCVWSPRSLDAALSRAGFHVLGQGLASPDLTRYRLGLPVRAGLTVVDWVGRLTARRSRLWVLASP